MSSKSPEPLLVAFGAAVRELRERRGLSQDALAQGAELQRTYVNEVERGRRNVTLLNVGRLAAGLGVGVGELTTVAEGHLASGAGVEAERRR